MEGPCGLIRANKEEGKLAQEIIEGQEEVEVLRRGSRNLGSDESFRVFHPFPNSSFGTFSSRNLLTLDCGGANKHPSTAVLTCFCCKSLLAFCSLPRYEAELCGIKHNVITLTNPLCYASEISPPSSRKFGGELWRTGSSD